MGKFRTFEQRVEAMDEYISFKVNNYWLIDKEKKEFLTDRLAHMCLFDLAHSCYFAGYHASKQEMKLPTQKDYVFLPDAPGRAGSSGKWVLRDNWDKG